MNQTSLEITDNEYCIKLNKGNFDLHVIQRLVQRIEGEQLAGNRAHRDAEEDIISRGTSMRDEGNFDRLSDK